MIHHLMYGYYMCFTNTEHMYYDQVIHEAEHVYRQMSQNLLYALAHSCGKEEHSSGNKVYCHSENFAATK